MPHATNKIYEHQGNVESMQSPVWSNGRNQWEGFVSVVDQKVCNQALLSPFMC